MAQPVLADTLLSRLDDYERRLIALERTPQIPQITTFAAGPVFDQVIEFESTTSTTYTDLATPGPEVTVVVGQSGRVIVTAGAYIVSTVDNQTVDVALSIDGGTAVFWAAVENLTGGAIGGSFSHSELLEHGQPWVGALDLSPGEHTFRLKYRQSLAGPNQGHFDLRFLQVQPY
jgi:hypothetical protein